MNSTTFPDDLDQPPVDPVELQLVGYTLDNLGTLDHVGKLRPHHFADGRLRSIYNCLLSEKQAGSKVVDPAVVARELPHLVSAAELERIKRQAQEMTPGHVESLAGKVIEGWRAREVRRKLSALTFEDMAPADMIAAARRQLDRLEAAAPGRADGDDHPLARFVAHAEHTPAVRWIIPGLIEHGVVTISGARGVGKTTALLPLAMVAAGLHHPDDPLAPKPGRWRHVVYIVEHVEQAQRIIAGIVRHGGLGISFEDVQERVHLVEARRLQPGEIAKVGKLYAERFTRNVNGVAVLPLVVFDTKAAVFELDNENDNSEASRAVAAIKQRFEGLPCWIIGHIAKAQFGSDDVKGLSDRGAGAFEADAIQNVYLVEDAKTKQRLLLLGKRRFEARWTELGVESHAAEVVAYDEWGDEEITWLRWGRLAPLPQSRTEAREQAQEAEEKERRGDMREAVLDAVQIAWQSGNPLSKRGVRGEVPGKTSEVLKEVESLLNKGWLHEINVPSKQRVNNAKSAFLVRLSTEEHDEFERSHVIPPAKLAIPASWKKPEIPLVPQSDNDSAKNAH